VDGASAPENTDNFRDNRRNACHITHMSSAVGNFWSGVGFKDSIAIYAAVLSTIVFCWQVFIYLRNGPRLRVTAAAGMRVFGPVPDQGEYLAITATNVGNAATTITHVVVMGYDPAWGRLRGPKEKYVLGRSTADHAPHPLAPGAGFLATYPHDPEIVRLSREFKLYAGVVDAVSGKETVKRVQAISG
jgi:hypothetical protein